MSFFPMITVFTPTYNRSHLLERLYKSLEKVGYDNFEWLIVDDGSNDSTKEIIEQFQLNANFKIRYFYKENGGKHTAINEGVRIAYGELFFIVDSDDQLPEDSLIKIASYYEEIKDSEDVAGIAGKRFFLNNEMINESLHQKKFKMSTFDFRHQLRCTQDMAEVYKTSVLLKYPFPEFCGEKFMTESIVWNRISENYQLLYIDEYIYLGEYQENGLTNNYRKLVEKDPKGSLLYYKELLSLQLSIEDRKNYAKRLNSIAKMNGYSKFEVLKMIGFRNFMCIYF